MELQGKLVSVTERVDAVSKNGMKYSTAFVVVETQEQYAKTIAFELFVGEKSTSDIIQQAASLLINSIVKVSFDLESREGSNGRWWTTAKAWRVQELEEEKKPEEATTLPEIASSVVSDELPF